MTIGEIQKMSGKDIQNLYESLPEPYYLLPINSDSDSLQEVLNDFVDRKPAAEERAALQDDLIALAKLGQVSKK